MKLRLLTICLIYFLPQTPVSGQALFPIPDKSVWGYITPDRNMVIKPKYQAAGDFSEGRAPVQINGKYGYINEKDSLVVAAKYDFAEPFSNGHGKVWLNGTANLVDHTGRLTKGTISDKKRQKHPRSTILDVYYGHTEVLKGYFSEEAISRIYERLHGYDWTTKDTTGAPDSNRLFISLDLDFGSRNGFRRIKLNSGYQLSIAYVDYALNNIIWGDYFKRDWFPDDSVIQSGHVLIQESYPITKGKDCSYGMSQDIWCTDEFLDKTPLKFKYPSQKVSLIWQAQDTVADYKKRRGVELYLINDTKIAYEFSNYGNVKLEAKDWQGHWRPILRGPISIYYDGPPTLILPPGTFSTYVIPLISGSFKTELRAMIVLNAENQIYSNSIPISLNPGQFWRFEDSDPFGIIRSNGRYWEE